MKKRTSFLLACLMAVFSYAQDTTSIKVELDQLNTPVTPAFTILGLSPTDISRPTLAKPFVLNLANALDGNGGLGRDMAIETTPYWWFSRPNLTFTDYYDVYDDAKQGILTNAWQNFSFSIATNDPSPDSDSINARNIAGGFRTLLVPGNVSQKFKDAYTSMRYSDLYRNVISNLLRQVDQGRITNKTELIAKVDTTVGAFISVTQEFNDVSAAKKSEVKTSISRQLTQEMGAAIADDAGKDGLETFLNNKEATLAGEAIKTIENMTSLQRVGWMVEIAGAASLFLPTNQLDYSLGENWGLWGTVSYRLDENDRNINNEFNFMLRASGQYLNSDAFNFDSGLSWVVSGESFSLTVEGILRNYEEPETVLGSDGFLRRRVESKVTSRYAVAFQYKLTDFINLTASLGKNYDNAFTTGGNLFTLFNANFLLPVKQELDGN